MSRRVNKRLEKDLDARRRAALAEESTHLRVGSWSGSEGCSVELIGQARDLHGTVCTCCAKRASKAVA